MFDFIEDADLRAKAEEAHKTQLEAAKEEISSGVDAKIEEAVSGLKTKNEELLNEKRTIQDTLKNFENLDPEKARDALKFLEENEDAQLIKDGKIDELIEKRTSTLKSDHEATVEELANKIKDLSKSSTLYKTLYENNMVDDNLREAAIAAKVRPEAISDILLRGRDVFSLAEDKSVESRDADGKLRKTADGEKVLTPVNWIEDLKKTSPHYWPPSEGLGAHGGSGGAGDDLTDQINRAAAKGDMATYRKLRAKQQKQKSGK